MRPNRLIHPACILLTALLSLAACSEAQTGPVRVVAIGPQPFLLNPNREAVAPASALLLSTVAQGLVRFDAAGEIEPALAQSWIVSDDGLRYTFRLRRTLWARGERVTAKQVVERLQAALGRSSRNPLKPTLGAIEQVEAMTDQVLEIRLRAPRPNFLQLLAQPQMAILSGNEGTGPYRMGGVVDSAIRLIPPPPDEDADVTRRPPPDILLRADPASAAIARFALGQADLVTGGTLSEVPMLAAAGLPGEAPVFDPARGLLGLMFVRSDGPLAEPRFRHALNMAVDRDAILSRFGAPVLQPRLSILPQGIAILPAPAFPDYAAIPFAARRETAARIVADIADVERPRIRVAMPPGPGYRILFAHLRRDWRAIGVDAVAVAQAAAADLRLIDQVAPADLPSWYLLHFVCGSSAVCDPVVDQLLETARTARVASERQALLAEADRMLVAGAAFIPIGQPIRWSLRSQRLNGFRTNPFALHAPTELIGRQ